MVNYNEIGFSAVFLITDQETQNHHQKKKKMSFMASHQFWDSLIKSITPKLIY